MQPRPTGPEGVEGGQAGRCRVEVAGGVVGTSVSEAPPPQLPPNSTWPVLLLSIRHNPTLCPLLALPPGPAPTQ